MFVFLYQSFMSVMAFFNFQVDDSSEHNLLAIPVGIKQKYNVDAIVEKVLYSIYVEHPRKWTLFA